MNPNWYKRAAVVLAISGFSCVAQAQYVWINERGVKQFSDMPPPASVPNSRILKSPGAPVVSASSNAGEDQDSATAPKEKAQMTLAEKNAEFQKRRMEQAAREKKAAEEEKLAAGKAKNCAQARSYQQALQAGDRIARRDSNGERVFLTDDQRTQEIRETQRILADCM